VVIDAVSGGLWLPAALLALSPALVFALRARRAAAEMGISISDR